MRRVGALIAVIAAVVVPTALAGDTARLQVALREIKQSTLKEQDALVGLGKKPIDWRQVKQDAFAGGILAGSAHVQRRSPSTTARWTHPPSPGSAAS